MASKEEMVLAVKAVHSKFFDRDKVQECLDIQKVLAQQGKEFGLMEILMKKGYLSARQLLYLKTGDGVGLDMANPKDQGLLEGYYLDRKIGQGGMATVYQGRRLDNGLICAVKVLFTHHAQNPRLVDGFLNEGGLLQRLQHDNVVRGFDTGHSNGFHYMALEYVEGVTVLGLLEKKGALSEELALHIILQVARALTYLASQNITHRDIKPGNMLIDASGRIKLCDLGFAKTSVPEGGQKEEETTCGTVQYISPEQATGRSDVDIRSDIYSLGATLYHLVVGEVPFSGSDSMEVMAKQLREGLSCQKVKTRNISRHLHYFLEKMMAKEREIRYENPGELIEDIERTVEGNKSLQFNPYGDTGSPHLAELAEVFRELGLPTVEESLAARRPRSDTRRNPLAPPERRRGTSRITKPEGQGPTRPRSEPGKAPVRRSSRLDKYLGRRRKDGE
ncbi:MAG: serine/threonine protein kinase [Planctomycetes bacterium]|nr:serine/threonine protein kinase [Planctomycetota bacterium]